MFTIRPAAFATNDPMPSNYTAERQCCLAAARKVREFVHIVSAQLRIPTGVPRMAFTVRALHCLKK